MAGGPSGGELLQGGPTGCRRLAGGRRKGRRERLDGKRDIPGNRTCEKHAPWKAGVGALEGVRPERRYLGRATSVEKSSPEFGSVEIRGFHGTDRWRDRVRAFGVLKRLGPVR